MSSPQAASGQKVPAWKRLGLKLKPAASESAEPSTGPAAGSQPNGAGKQDLGVNASSAAKRKRPDVSAHPAPDDSASPLKKTRFDHNKNTKSSAKTATPRLRKQKSVTFTDDTKSPADADTANGVKTPAKKHKSGKKAKTKTQDHTAALKPALEYLKTWKESRGSWKFNKNHQTLLIKRAFDPHAFPSDHIESFYEYIRDLKGHPRQRLRQTARNIRKEDAKKGSAGFPEGTMDVQAKQAEYDAIIAGILQLGLGAGTKRKRFDEVSFMDQPPETILAQRVIKRMRAEVIVDELYDSDDESSDSEAETATTDATTVQAPSSPVKARLDDRARAAPLPVEDGKRVRRRKMRVAADDTSSEESSSESESDSDDSDSSSGTDGDDSSDSESEDEQANNDDDSSDSSDSDSSDSEEEEEEDDDDSEDSDSDDSSDSDSEDEQPAKATAAAKPKAKA